jgi:hypothetical protein
MSTVRTACALAGAALLTHSAAAQRWEVELPFAEPDVAADVLWMAQGDPRPGVHMFNAPAGRTMAFVANEMGHERVVKGAPYCADALHESIQPLTDGNRIVRKQVTRLCRDGEGRTRQEVELDGHKRVYLRDPVAREAWLVDPERKTARRLYGGGGRFEMPAAADSAAWRDYADRMREWARTFGERMRSMPHAPAVPEPPGVPATATPPAAPAMPPAGPVSWSAARPVVIVSGEPAQQLAAAAGDAPDARSVDVQVLRLRDGEGVHGLPPLPDVGPMLPLPIAQRLPAYAPRGPGVLTPLGSKEIEGLRVDGERTTWTIEAGRLGNEKPIVITREVWTSPELLLTVRSRDADPRSGETHYRLTNVRRGEPDPALMKPPADHDLRRGGQPRGLQPGASGRG